ncbi:MAG: hypothetical protein GOMPHAMPRED_000968 [Gomphillus americanus]|uniref:Nascent polypeptide-associated complex subunit alpha-like UBA domain-containing protein n=1 Tax=Gomphillus americanus TaxID=1940652 RepID=A0A8H3F3H2_9LECA|nr:MAG: hypothetical protein GOMPHAMPRED_000968 [Gomphillus americanus]
MAEPQPPTITEGLDPAAPNTETESEPAPKGSTDSRRAAAALSSLDARTDDDSKNKPSPSAADRQALGDAMTRLEGLELGSKASALSSTTKSPEKERKEREAEDRRKVKVDAADVALVVEELELTKVKATELLKSYGGDAVRAITAYVNGVV